MNIAMTIRKIAHNRKAGLAASVTASLMAGIASAQVPTVVFGSSVGINNAAPISGTFGGSAYGGTTGHIAANARGDMFYEVNPYGGTNYVVELPANSSGSASSALVQILSNVGANSSGVTTDANGNLYVADGNSSGSIDYVPLVAGVYATGTNASTLATCSLPLSGNTAPCTIPLSKAGVGYYFQPKDVQVDAAGDLFMYVATGYVVMAPVPTGTATSYVMQSVVKPTATPTSGVTLAADSAGDLYYDDGATVTYYTAASLTAAFTSVNGGGTAYATGTSVGNGLSSPQGVTLDSAGNLYISDKGNTRIAVIPLISGARSTANQYTLVSGVTSNTGVGVDGFGNIYYENGNQLFEVQLGSVNLGGGNQYYQPTTTVTATFTSAATLGSFTFTGRSASAFTISSQNCTNGNAYAAGATCTVTIKFTTPGPGLQTAAINAATSTGALLGSAIVYSYPTAAGINIDPGTVSTVGSAWKVPSALAVGVTGTVFVADSTTGVIYSSVAGAAQTVVASGFSAPSAVAVDPIGNLYVADTGNNRIVEVPYANGAYGTHIILATGLSGPSGLSLGDTGVLYVADSGNGRVLILGSAAGQPLGSLSSTLVSGLTTPVGVAADNFGSLFIADAGTRKVIQLNLSTHTQTAIVTGASTLSGVATAPDGSVYVIDSGAKTLTRIPSINGVLTPGSSVVLPSPVITPSSIATDINNNLFVADKTAAVVTEVNRSIGNLAFGKVASGSSSSPMTATVTNPGNTALTFYSIYNSPASVPYTEQASSTCPTSFNANLAAGASCTIVEVFNPTTGGSFKGSIGFSSSAVIGGQTVTLTGNLPTITGTASLVYGTSNTYTLTASPDGPYTVSITGSATSSAAVTVSGGTGTFTLPLLGVGSYKLSATDGNSNIATESVTVTPALLTVTVSGTPSRIYGQANPAFTASITGFVSPDTAASATTGSASLTTTATPKSPAASYPITVGQGTLAAANYTFTEINGSLTVTGGAAQSIFFPALLNYTHGTSVPLVAMTTSGLPVSYTVSGPATVSNGVLTITGTGSVTVTATQSGNSNFSAATSVSRTFTAQ